MLEEIGLPFEANTIDTSRNETWTPEFLSLNPDGKIPAILDPDGPSGVAPVRLNPPRHDGGGGLGQYPGHRKNALLLPAKTKEFPSQCKWFGAIGTVVVLLSGVLPFVCGVGVRPGIFYARRQREGHEDH